MKIVELDALDYKRVLVVTIEEPDGRRYKVEIPALDIEDQAGGVGGFDVAQWLAEHGH